MSIWVEKYSPNTIDDMILDPSLKDVFKHYISENNLPCITLAGKPGIGKTTCAKLIIDTLPNCNSIYINASDENGIDTVRNKISNFVDIEPINNGLKVVILDEADGLTTDGQKCLRNIIEKDLADTRFILTCNFPDKLIDPIKSRCPIVNIKYSVKDVIIRIFSILKEEKIDNIKTEKNNIIAKIKKYYPDIRKCINILEQCCISNSFKDLDIENTSTFDSTIEYIINNIRDLKKCREFWIKNETNFGTNYTELAGSLFNYFSNENNCNPSLMIDLGEKYYQLNMVLDKEIGFYMMVLKLHQYIIQNE